MIYVIGYVLIGILVGKLCSNVFLNRAYDREMRRFNLSHKSKYSSESDEDYTARMKADAYDEALSRSEIDRAFSFAIGAIVWPVAVLILAGYYIRQAVGSMPSVDLGLSKAGRDMKAAQKQAKEAEQQKAIEAERNEAWNAMVDLLNENGINHLNYEKR